MWRRLVLNVKKFINGENVQHMVKKCSNCGRLNHFAVACAYAKKVKEIKEADEESDDLYVVSSIYKNMWIEKIKVEDIFINFKIDTGSQVNILPKKILN